MRCCSIHLIAISQKILIVEMSLKFTKLRLQSNLPGANELTYCDWDWGHHFADITFRCNFLCHHDGHCSGVKESHQLILLIPDTRGILNWISSLISIHFGLVMPCGNTDIGQHRFGWWLVTYKTPSHYLKQCRLIVSWTPTNKLYGNFN